MIQGNPDLDEDGNKSERGQVVWLVIARSPAVEKWLSKLRYRPSNSDWKEASWPPICIVQKEGDGVWLPDGFLSQKWPRGIYTEHVVYAETRPTGPSYYPLAGRESPKLALQILWIDAEPDTTPATTQYLITSIQDDQGRGARRTAEAYRTRIFQESTLPEERRCVFIQDSKEQADSLAIYQSIAIVQEMIETDPHCTAQYHSLAWLQSMLREKPDVFNPARTLVLFNRMHHSECDPAVDDAYAVCADRSIPCYPRLEEARAYREKLGDIEVLDRIAEETLIEAWSRRPVTCWGRDGTCTLSAVRRKQAVLKQTHSSYGQGVVLRARGTSHRQRDPHHAPDTSGPRWFHQEYVPSLRQAAHGEFRVFIIRSHGQAKVRSILRTYDRRNGWFDIIPLTAELEPEDCGLQSGRTYQNLVDFSLYIFEQLRRAGSETHHFSSLDVGARLDVWQFDGGFCVGEVTRIFAGDLFLAYMTCTMSRALIKYIASAMCTAFSSDRHAHEDDGRGGCTAVQEKHEEDY